MRLRGRVTIGGTGLAAIAAGFLLLTSGCGYGGVASASSHPDTPNGGTLFPQKCGSCHTLQAAGTSGTIGPNLDNAFAGSRKQGYEQSTIENLVLDQIRLGSGPIATYTTSKKFTSRRCLSPVTKDKCSDTPMPANIVTGQDAIDIAAYVASVAGTSGYTTSVNLASLTKGIDIFKAAGCAGCHTLKSAGASGAYPGAPNLDQIASALTVAVVARQVTNGGAVMPAFKGRLTPAQIQAVAQYVSSVAGK